MDIIQKAGFQPALHESLELLGGIFKNSPETCFVIEETGSGRVAGYLLTYPTTENRNDYSKGWKKPEGKPTALYIHDLCIHPDFQGQKLATQLYAWAEAQTRYLGLKFLCAVAIEGTFTFWERQGFIKMYEYPYHGVVKADYITKSLG